MTSKITIGQMALRSVSILFLLMLVWFWAGCETGTEPTPEEPFAGVYAGAGTYSLEESGGVRVVTSFLRIEAVQSGRQMTISGSETVNEQITAVSAVTGQVSETGFFTSSQRAGLGTYRLHECGQSSTVDFTLAFAGEHLRITERMMTTSCGEIAFSAVLVRER